jgi:hypothetical protein
MPSLLKKWTSGLSGELIEKAWNSGLKYGDLRPAVFICYNRDVTIITGRPAAQLQTNRAQVRDSKRKEDLKRAVLDILSEYRLPCVGVRVLEDSLDDRMWERFRMRY